MHHHAPRPRSLPVLIGTLATFALLASAAEATPPRGGSGGSSFSLDCGSDAVLAGVTVRAGTLVDSVEAICVKVKAGGSWSGGSFSRGKAGGGGGAPVSLPCDGNWAVMGIHGRSGALVDRLGVRCGKLGVQNKTVKIVEGNVLRGAGGGGGGSAFDDTCPAGQVGRGLRGRAGALVDQIELACHNPTVESTAPAAQTAAPKTAIKGSAQAAVPMAKLETGIVRLAQAPSISSVTAATAAGYVIRGSNFGFDPGQVKVYEGGQQVPASAVVSVEPDTLRIRRTPTGPIDHRVSIRGVDSNVVPQTHPPVAAAPPAAPPRTVAVPPGFSAVGHAP